MPANQLSVSFSYTYSSELQAVKSAISVIQLYILQNLRPLASSFWKQCAFVCWSLLHLWVAQSGGQYMPCPCKKERGKVGAEVTCMHIDSGCCICCLYFLWPNYCLVSGRKGFSCVATGGHALFKLSLLLQASYNLTAWSSFFDLQSYMILICRRLNSLVLGLLEFRRNFFRKEFQFPDWCIPGRRMLCNISRQKTTYPQLRACRQIKPVFWDK